MGHYALCQTPGSVRRWAVGLLAVAALCATASAQDTERPPQYQHEDILIEGAWADEPKLESVSVKKALDYLEKGATAWSRGQGCIACHTTGEYLRMRPLLSESLGKPSEELRDLFVSQLAKLEWKGKGPAGAKALKKRVTSTQVAYVAMGLAEWDAQITGRLSDETSRALTLMFSAQAEDGSWANGECWPPFESSDYQAATVAAMAMATAPGWLENVQKKEHKSGLAKTRQYLRKTPPPHVYGEVLLLWASTRWPELLQDTRRQEILKKLFALQQEDGGWSIRRFARPEQWGDGLLAEKLRAEREFQSPPSDGHMTGLAVIVALDAGVSRDDKRIQKALKWLEKNQRVSGRWWTRSMYGDGFHFITFSATLNALVALDKSGKWKRLQSPSSH